MAKLKIDQPAPVFTLADLEGRMVALADFIEKTVIVNFWSAECPWAERADRVLAGWQDRVTLLNIAPNANEPPEMLRQVARARGLRIVLPDPEQRVANLYGAEITPQLFLIDAGGILRYQGAFDDVNFRQRTPTRNYIQEALDTLLTLGPPLPIEETPPYGCTIVRAFAI